MIRYVWNASETVLYRGLYGVITGQPGGHHGDQATALL